MTLAKFLAVAIIVAVLKTSSATFSCQLEDDDDGTCSYKVVCLYYPGSALNPSCDGPKNITFVVTSSFTTEVNTLYFGATNFDIAVRTIIAINNTWSRITALSFRYYSKSTYFDFSHNYIEEIDSEAFKTLTNLQYLNLSNNRISELDPKSFFIVESKSTNLETLDLSDNSIKFIPDEVFSYVPSLEKLYLQGNRLKTLSEHSFWELRYLNVLNLRNNYIGAINKSLNCLLRLKYLDISHNVLQKLSFYDILQNTALEKIYMSNNVIETIDNDCFHFATNLTEADFSYNNISTKICDIMFAANTNLKYLNFYCNRISKINENSFKNNPLVYLNVSNNKLSGEINSNTFNDLQITELDLSQQNITVLRDNAFGNMKQLLKLNLSTNYIYNIDDGAFKNSNEITILDLSFNNISRLLFLSSSLTKLDRLYLPNNNITVLHKNTFLNQAFIKQLDLSHNNIITIEEYALPLQNLQVLNIQNNKFTGVLDRNMLSPARYLRYLDFTYVNISKISNMTFINMPVLARLNLSHSAIEIIEPVNFIGMENLYSIDVSFNNLKELRFNNSLLTKLKSAYLNNNKFTNICRIFSSKCNLSYIDMSHNHLTTLSCLDANLFPNLQVLHLSNNLLINFDNNYTNTLKNLVELKLSSNNITEINLSSFSQLLSIDLSNNNLNVINSTFFTNIEFLQSMDLSLNNISDLPPGTFQNMKNLKFVNLSSNHLTKLRYGSLKGLHKTELFDISSNKIESLDANVFHDCTQLKTLIIDYNRIKTLDIERLVLVTQKSLKTLSLGGNPISCHEIIRKGALRDLSFYGLNQIEVTSIHQIYHEDNVHGIKCGEEIMSSTATNVTADNGANNSMDSSSVGTLVWCAVLTIILLAIMVVFVKWRKQHGGLTFYSESRVNLGSSYEVENSQYDYLTK